MRARLSSLQDARFTFQNLFLIVFLACAGPRPICFFRMLAATSALPFTVFVFELLYVITLCHFLTFFVFVFLLYAINFSQLVFST